MYSVNGIVVTKATRKQVIETLQSAGVKISSNATTAQVREVLIFEEKRAKRAAPKPAAAPAQPVRYVGQRAYTPREHDFDTRYRYNGWAGISVFVAKKDPAPNWRVGQTVLYGGAKFRVDSVRDTSRGTWFYLE